MTKPKNADPAPPDTNAAHESVEMETLHPIDKLINIMRALRNPDGGCPWDLEQDFKSIAPYTIEEAYEVADAIERDDMTDLREELGDLILQPIYHAQMAAEDDTFDIYDVINDVSAKMIARHPHVFGDKNAQSAEDVNAIWEQKKQEEKTKQGKSTDSALDGVTKSLPALLRAQKLQKKAAKTGFEWKSVESVMLKLDEELLEMRDALTSEVIEDIADEIGDILFVMANLARVVDLNPETVLRQANDKFERRFRGMEQDFKMQKEVMSDASLDQMIEMWKKQKQKERT